MKDEAKTGMRKGGGLVCPHEEIIFMRKVLG